jgi:hypothetical protein
MSELASTILEILESEGEMSAESLRRVLYGLRQPGGPDPVPLAEVEAALAELGAINRALKPEEEKAAKEREREGGRKKGLGKFPYPKGQTRDRIAHGLGTSGRTLEKIETVLQADGPALPRRGVPGRRRGRSRKPDIGRAQPSGDR